jgi:UDP-N-acetylglucosamine transferase subunit ALG13
MGTIINALSLGKPLLVMPRRAHLGEQRNDHQWATVRALAARPGLLIASDETELPSCLDRLVSESGSSAGEMRAYADDGLIQALRNVIFD